MTQQNMKIFDALRPLLENGVYTVDAALEVRNGSAREEMITRSQILVVETPPDRLAPSLIASTYPPANHGGRFEGILPCLVLKDATLPWQRTAGDMANSAKPGGGDAGRPLPWLALILIEPEDMASIATERRPLPGGAMSEALTIPAGLTGKLLPSADALPWLTHVRRVDVADKPTTPEGKLPPTDYSVIVCNRPPRGNGLHAVHLVSVDGLATVLDNPGVEAVRLISLFSWTFSIEGAGESFTRDLNELDFGPLALPARLPGASARDPAADGDAALDLLVKRAMAKGFCALPHHLRGGGRSVSWYRGPLLPVKGNPRTEAVLQCNGDALLGYDPALGMFDVSLAAAWQLGRLMALAAPDYARALYRWRGQRIREAALNSQPAMGVLEADEPDVGAPSSRTSVAAVKARRDAAFPPLPATIDAAGLLTRLKAVAEREQAVATTSTDAEQDTVTKWLGGLYLLNGVPLHYLVPDAAMLPDEAMRFFRLDRNWIEALMSGALAIGAEDTTVGAALREELRDRARRGLGQERFCLIDRHAAEPASRPEVGGAMLSGFLLRSRIIAACPGLEVKVLGPSGGAMDKLRMEMLAPDILLCLFDGEMTSLEFIEPAEGARFSLGKKATAFTTASGRIDFAGLARSLGKDSRVADLVKAMAVKRRSVLFEMKG